MKHFQRHTFHLVVLACVIMFFYSCEQDPKFKIYDYPVPVVESVYPTDGYVTTQVVITGTNFGDRTEAVKVFFGEVQARKVLDCKNNRIVVEVPETAASGELSLQIYNKKVENIAHYTVLATPRVITVTSDSEDGEGVADAGDKVTIKGENFGVNAADISVSFNGTPAEFQLVDETTIIATTPQGYATGNVIVTIHGYEMIGSAMFNPNSKGDVTVLYLENYGTGFRKADPAEGAFNKQWYTPAIWIGNAASADFNMALQDVGDAFLAFQVGWQKAAYNNGKLYQATTLRKGTYRLEVTTAASDVQTDDGNKVFAFIVGGTGVDDIPNVDAISQMDDSKGVYIEYTKRGADAGGETLTTPSFTVGDKTQVVVGFLTSMNKANSYFKVSQVKLILE